MPAPSLPVPSLPTLSLPVPSAAAPSGAPPAPASPVAAPSFSAPVLPPPGIVAAPVVPILAAPAVPAPVSHPTPTLPKAQPSTGPKWKPIQRSKARKALNGLIGVAVLTALAGGAWFGYQSLAPAEDTTTPTTLLIDNPDTFVGQANAVVNQINEQAPDQEVLDLVGVESPDSPVAPAPAPESPATTAP